MPPILPEFAPDDPALALLLQWYDAMEGRLIETLRDATIQGWEREQARAMLRGLDIEIRRLDKATGVWDASYMREQYVTGQMYADGLLRDIEGLPGDLIDEPLTPPREALARLAREASGNRDRMLTAILRQSDDYLRRLATGELAQGLGLGKSSYAVGKAIREASIEAIRRGPILPEIARGIMTASGVVYSDGSVHSLHAYGQMSARTGMANALRAGQEDRFAATGLVHVIKVPANGTLCWKCAQFESKCFALDAEGEQLGYPPISVLYEQMIHPQCRHLGWIPVVFPDPRTDLPPEKWTQTADDKELYRRFREEHPERYQASRQGFATSGELRKWKAGNPEVPAEALRGPRWRYRAIEARRQDAIVDMLLEPELKYADAVAEQTRQFMATEAYLKQRAKTGELSPAAQRRAAEGR